jgi:hypothetical protein
MNPLNQTADKQKSWKISHFHHKVNENWALLGSLHNNPEERNSNNHRELTNICSIHTSGLLANAT